MPTSNAKLIPAGPDRTHDQINKAKEAIVYVLNRIKCDADVRHYMGFGTESFAQLTEAAALLFDENVDRIQKFYADPNAKWEGS